MKNLFLFFTKCLFIIIFSSLSFNIGFSQISVEIKRMENSNNSQHNYAVSLKNNAKQSVYLAGQNYRFYYDTKNSILNESSITSLLTPSYTPLKLVSHFFDIDASGFGLLSYDSNLGFVNLAVDYKDGYAQPIELTPNEKIIIFTCQFDGAEPTITWAQDNLTHTYATAFVELALMDRMHKPIKTSISEYLVTNSSTTQVQEAELFDSSIFPNPFRKELTVTFNNTLKSDCTVSVFDIFGIKGQNNEYLKRR